MRRVYYYYLDLGAVIEIIAVIPNGFNFINTCNSNR